MACNRQIPRDKSLDINPCDCARYYNNLDNRLTLLVYLVENSEDISYCEW